MATLSAHDNQRPAQNVPLAPAGRPNRPATTLLHNLCNLAPRLAGYSANGPEHYFIRAKRCTEHPGKSHLLNDGVLDAPARVSAAPAGTARPCRPTEGPATTTAKPTSTYGPTRDCMKPEGT
jgi:hypothetical protein